MRVSPIGIWCAGNPTEAARLARIDSSLTHGNPVCLEACAAFAAAIAAGVAGADRASMFATANHVVMTSTLAGRMVAEALERARSGKLPQAHGCDQGSVLIALQIAFRQMLHVDSFEEALVEAVGLGGDTDTNGAIAGALLGALHGRRDIPTRWVLPVLACRPTSDQAKHPRPMEYWPDDVIDLAESLLVRTNIYHSAGVRSELGNDLAE